MFDFTNSSTIYISATEGSDAYTGFAPHPEKGGAGPLRSFRRLRELLVGMHTVGHIQPITVRIEGEHYFTETYTLGSISGGYVMRDITFEGYGDTPARLVGGRRLTGFAPDTFHGAPCISLHIPEVESGAWRFTDLYVNGQRASSARYPREGTLRAVAVERMDAQKLGDGSKWFIAHKEDLAGIDGIEDAIVSFYHYWVDEHSPVESYDPETGKLVMAYRSRFKNTVNYDKNDTSEFCYYLENIPAAFGAPNDWYLDVPRGMLYYVPEDPTVDPADLAIYAPTVEQIITVQGKPELHASGIRFRNLEFLCSRGDYASRNAMPGSDAPIENYASDAQSLFGGYGALRFKYATNCAVENCRFTALGLHAVEISHGCERVRIERSTFESLGGGGVKIFGHIAGESEENRTAYCSVIGNKITHIGRRYAAACGVLICHASYNEIADNEISYTDYSGISVGFVWGYTPTNCYGNVIRRNHVHHIGVGLLSDMAAIYLLGMQSGTVVEDNYVHDVVSGHYGGHGIYTDEGSSYVSIERNIVVNCKSNCFYQHYGIHNTVRDNIFAFGQHGVVAMGRSEGHIGVVFENNTVISAAEEPMYHSYASGGFTQALHASGNRFYHPENPDPTIFISRTPAGARKVTLAEWQQEFHMDEGSTLGLPDGFKIDYENRRLTFDK